MKPKKAPKATAEDKAWQKKVEEKLKSEKMELNHPKGKERFEKIVKRASKKKASS